MSRTPIRTASSTLRSLLAHAEAEGVSQADLSRGLGSPPHVLFRYRAGQRTPDIMTVEALADVLGLRLALVPKRSASDA